MNADQAELLTEHAATVFRSTRQVSQLAEALCRIKSGILPFPALQARGNPDDFTVYASEDEVSDFLSAVLDRHVNTLRRQLADLYSVKESIWDSTLPGQ